MNPYPHSLRAALLTLCAAAQVCLAQGPLTPPGAPAPTMKSLDQIEARTPISSVPYTISTPGSYYLTANLSVNSGDAIDITASGVTLDLNGFTLSSSEATPTGTAISLAGGNADITILNGHIVCASLGIGFANGIYFSSSNPLNVLVSHVSVSGCAAYGIFLGTANSTVVEACTVQAIGVSGIEAASVSHSSVNQCGGNAIVANLADSCYGNCSGSAEGLYVGTANNCYGYNSGSGVAIHATIAIGCYGFSGAGTGLVASIANSSTGVRSGDPNPSYSVTHPYNMP